MPKNPRTWKSLVAAKFAGVDLASKEISIPDTKTPEYLAKFPFGKAPTMDATEGPLFESSAIAYYVASQKEELVGKSAYEKASIVQWLMFTDVEFYAAFAQWAYPIWGYATSDKAAHAKTVEPIEKICGVLNSVLANRTYLVGEQITLADIVLACAMVPAFSIFLTPSSRMSLQHLTRWFQTVVNQPQAKAVLGEIAFCEERAVYTPAAAAPKPAAAAPKAAAVAAPKPAANNDEEEEAPKPKAKTSFDLLPPTTFNLEDWKRFYSNNDTRPTAIDYFWKNYDPAGFTIWRIDYKYNDELTRIFMTCNLITGFFARMGALHKYCFGSVLIFGEDNANEVSGYLVLRGTEMPPEMKDVPDFESFDFRRMDINDAKERALFEDYLAWDGELAGKKFAEGKTFK